jgi:hypothetical protein
MNLEEIDIFEKVHSQLEGLHSEISALSKKAQNDALNKFKLKYINQILAEANKILGEKYKPFPDFDLFDDDLPNNSDVTFIVSQYLGCMEKLRADNIDYHEVFLGGKDTTAWYWKGTEQRTSPPMRIKEK